MTRPDLDTYFMDIARVVATRSTCLHNQVGAVLVKNKKILSTGYNGAPSGMPHCTEIGCAREHVKSGTHAEICRAVHAEQSALIQVALHGGFSVCDATIYCTHQPCHICSKMLINAGIYRVVYDKEYADIKGLELLAASGILVERIHGE